MKDFKQVDPKTIKFDFKDAKIKVNNTEECKWIQEVAFANNIEWNPDSAAKGKNLYWLDNCTGLFFDEYITRTSDEKLEYFNENDNYKEITIQDILNNMKEEIVGYETVVDLPGIPKGTKSEAHNGVWWTFESNQRIYAPAKQTYSEEEVLDTRFFKPIYKAKEIVINISKGRSIKVKDKIFRVYDDNNKFRGDLEIEMVIKILQDLGCTTKKTYSGNEVTALSIKVGCQSFTERDITSIVHYLIDNQLI